MHSSITLQLFGASLDVYYTVLIGSPLRQQWWGPSSIKEGGREGERAMELQAQQECKLDKEATSTRSKLGIII